MAGPGGDCTRWPGECGPKMHSAPAIFATRSAVLPAVLWKNVCVCVCVSEDGVHILWPLEWGRLEQETVSCFYTSLVNTPKLLDGSNMAETSIGPCQTAKNQLHLGHVGSSAAPVCGRSQAADSDRCPDFRGTLKNQTLPVANRWPQMGYGLWGYIGRYR